MRDELLAIADEVAALDARVGDLVYEALRAQVRGEEEEGARELERQLARVRRALTKGEQVLRTLATTGETAP